MQGISLSKQPSVLEHALRHLRYLKSKADEATQVYESHHAHVIDLMAKAGRKTMKVDDMKATTVTRSVSKYDEKGLAKALGATTWNKVTKKVLDKAKLEDLIERGEVDLNVVAQHTTIAPSKPYIRLSAVLEGDPDE